MISFYLVVPHLLEKMQDTKIYYLQMENRNPPASPSRSKERSPFTNLTNTLSAGSANTTSEGLRKQKSKGPKSWYARLSDEKRAEYNQKRRACYA